MPFAFLVGLILGFIRIKTGSLTLGMIIHGYNNLFAVILDYLKDQVSMEILKQVYLIYLITALFASILGIVVYSQRNNNGEAFRLTAGEGAKTTKMCCKWFFSHPVIIIFMVICGLEALTFFN